MGDLPVSHIVCQINIFLPGSEQRPAKLYNPLTIQNYDKFSKFNPVGKKSCHKILPADHETIIYNLFPGDDSGFCFSLFPEQ